MHSPIGHTDKEPAKSRGTSSNRELIACGSSWDPVIAKGLIGTRFGQQPLLAILVRRAKVWGAQVRGHVASAAPQKCSKAVRPT